MRVLIWFEMVRQRQHHTQLRDTSPPLLQGRQDTNCDFASYGGGQRPAPVTVQAMMNRLVLSRHAIHLLPSVPGWQNQVNQNRRIINWDSLLCVMLL